MFGIGRVGPPYQGKEMSGDGTPGDGIIELKLQMVEMRSALKAQQDQFTTLVESVHQVSRRLDDVTRLQTGHETQNEAIGRAFKAIKELADSTKQGFERIDNSHQKTRDKVLWFSGAAAMLSIIASACVGLVMYYTNQIDANQQRDRERIEHSVSDHDTRIRTLETYIPRTYPDTHP